MTLAVGVGGCTIASLTSLSIKSITSPYRYLEPCSRNVSCIYEILIGCHLSLSCGYIVVTGLSRSSCRTLHMIIVISFCFCNIQRQSVDVPSLPSL